MKIQGNWSPIKTSKKEDSQVPPATERQKQETSDPKASTRCMSVQIPVQIATRRMSGSADVYNAKAVLVNQRGARFECTERVRQQPFKLNADLWVTILPGKQSTGGKVVWSDSRPNSRGNFEFVAELDDSASLLKAVQQAQNQKEDGGGDEQPVADSIAPAPITSSANPAQAAMESALSDATNSAETAPESEDASKQMLHALLEDLDKIKSADPAEAFAAQHPAFSMVRIPDANGNTPATAASNPGEDAETMLQGETEDERDSAAPSSEAASGGFGKIPAPIPSVRAAERPGPTGQLAEAIKLLESAVQMDAASERVAKEVREEIASTRQAAVAEIQTQAQTVFSSQKALLEARAAELVRRSSALLEEALRRYMEASEMGARRIQEEAEKTFAALDQRRKQASVEQLELQEKFLQECRTRAEQLLGSTIESARGALLRQTDEMAKSLTGRVQTVFTESMTQFEQHCSKKSAETLSRVDEQLGDSAADIRGSFLQNATNDLRELGAQQKKLLQEAEQQLNAITEQNLLKLQGGLAHMLQGLADLSRYTVASTSTPRANGVVNVTNRVPVGPSREIAFLGANEAETNGNGE